MITPTASINTTSLSRRRVTVIDALRRRVAEAPEATFMHWLDDADDALSPGQDRWSYRDLDEMSGRWASLLLDAGVSRGDRVAILSTDGRTFLGAFLGCLYVGAVAVPLNVELRGDSLRRPLRLFEPAVVVSDGQVLAIVAEAIAGLDVAIPLIDCSGEPQARFEPTQARETTKLSDPCLIMSTSGTTGPSKGSIWDYGTLETWVTTYLGHLGYTDADRVYCCTPLMHANALVAGVCTAIYAGCGVAYRSRFSVSRFWTDITRSGSTTACILGTMIHLLLSDRPQADFQLPDGFRTMLVSSCTSSAYERIVAEWGFYPVCAYGLTDFGNLTISSWDAPTPPGSCGRAASAFEIQLVDADGNPVPTGTAGELVVRTHLPWSAPQAYYGMPAETLESRRNLWFHTGDLLRQDPDGWFYFSGRLKEAMRYRGENVSAFEVESVFLSCPEVKEVAVYGVPSTHADDEIMATIVPEANGAALDLVELVHRVSQELPHFAVPRFVRVLESLPKNGSHRVIKSVLIAEGTPEGTWDREVAGVAIRRNRK